MKLEKSHRISMKTSKEVNEKWLQDQIAKDPSILNLGEIYLKDLERRQASGGRLDMLFEDIEGTTRYTVELQLGATDETHIIRTIEYWDIERKRYPNYEHVAVLVAEDITSRFFNVINLFNSQIPIIAIQISALQVGDLKTLHATTVLDLVQRPEDEETKIISADLDYWQKRTSPEIMKMADKLFKLINDVDPGAELSYKMNYCGISRNGKVENYVVYIPRKNHIGFHFRIPRSSENDSIIENLGFSILRYDRWGFYVIVVNKEDIENKHSELKQLINMAKVNLHGE
jgi:hypothetical protein